MARELLREATPFQLAGIELATRFLDAQGVGFALERVQGRGEVYFVLRSAAGARPEVEVFFYQGELGYSVGQEWRLLEQADFGSEREIVGEFASRLPSIFLG